ncbi:hypothetical protein [Streptomyces virginiae]|uniref:hypothetical protein n=1 Tax=Streptomyces virginiae TaxID=1961 RepID=UPI003679B5EA
MPGCLRLLLWLVLPVAPAALGVARGVEPALWGALAMLGLFVAVYGAYMSFDRRAFRLYELAARHREYRCTFSDSGVVTRLPEGAVLTDAELDRIRELHERNLRRL